LIKFKQYFDPLFGRLLPDYEEFQLEDCGILVWYSHLGFFATHPLSVPLE
jgi:hypothetical protein